MIITKEQLDLLEKHGFTLESYRGSPIVNDEWTGEPIAIDKALAIAMVREREMSKLQSKVAVGIRHGTLAYQLATEVFSFSDWHHTENDPKGSMFGLSIYAISKEDYDSFVSIYMDVSKRNQ